MLSSLPYIPYIHTNKTTEGSCFYEHDKNHSKDSFAPYRPYKPSPQEEDDPTLTARLDPCHKKKDPILDRVFEVPTFVETARTVSQVYLLTDAWSNKCNFCFVSRC